MSDSADGDGSGLDLHPSDEENEFSMYDEAISKQYQTSSPHRKRQRSRFSSSSRSVVTERPESLREMSPPPLPDPSLIAPLMPEIESTSSDISSFTPAAFQKLPPPIQVPPPKPPKPALQTTPYKLCIHNLRRTPSPYPYLLQLLSENNLNDPNIRLDIDTSQADPDNPAATVIANIENIPNLCHAVKTRDLLENHNLNGLRIRTLFPRDQVQVHTSHPVYLANVTKPVRHADMYSLFKYFGNLTIVHKLVESAFRSDLWLVSFETADAAKLAAQAIHESFSDSLADGECVFASTEGIHTHPALLKMTGFASEITKQELISHLEPFVFHKFRVLTLRYERDVSLALGRAVVAKIAVFDHEDALKLVDSQTLIIDGANIKANYFVSDLKKLFPLEVGGLGKGTTFREVKQLLDMAPEKPGHIDVQRYDLVTTCTAYYASEKHVEIAQKFLAGLENNVGGVVPLEAPRNRAAAKKPSRFSQDDVRSKQNASDIEVTSQKFGDTIMERIRTMSQQLRTTNCDKSTPTAQPPESVMMEWERDIFLNTLKDSTFITRNATGTVAEVIIRIQDPFKNQLFIEELTRIRGLTEVTNIVPLLHCSFLIVAKTMIRLHYFQQLAETILEESVQVLKKEQFVRLVNMYIAAERQESIMRSLPAPSTPNTLQTLVPAKTPKKCTEVIEILDSESDSGIKIEASESPKSQRKRRSKTKAGTKNSANPTVDRKEATVNEIRGMLAKSSTQEALKPGVDDRYANPTPGVSPEKVGKEWTSYKPGESSAVKVPQKPTIIAENRFFAQKLQTAFKAAYKLQKSSIYIPSVMVFREDDRVVKKNVNMGLLTVHCRIFSQCPSHRIKVALPAELNPRPLLDIIYFIHNHLSIETFTDTKNDEQIKDLYAISTYLKIGNLRQELKSYILQTSVDAKIEQTLANLATTHLTLPPPVYLSLNTQINHIKQLPSLSS